MARDGGSDDLAAGGAEGGEVRSGPLRPTVGLISLTSIPDDPRVRRQGDAFHRAGWNVVGVGLNGGLASPPPWEIRSVADAAGGGPPRWRRRLRNATARASVRVRRGGADAVYWSVNPTARALLQLASKLRVDLWIANDWETLPIVIELTGRSRAPFVYDTHELASAEYSQRFVWRHLHRPMIVEIERAGIARAGLVTCVSDGIAEELQRVYDLPHRPTVIRNVPPYQKVPFRPSGTPIEVLYHGVVSPGRGLEACIRSVARWRPEFRLTIRGPASEQYLAGLAREAEAAGGSNRVVFAPPVPLPELITSAAHHDIGLFALPADSLQNRLALPNKLFEYAMAGLALCVTDLPEMARLVRQLDLGTLMPNGSEASIAAAINGFVSSKVDHHRRKALAAARELNWEHESGKLLRGCHELLGARTAAIR